MALLCHAAPSRSLSLTHVAASPSPLPPLFPLASSSIPLSPYCRHTHNLIEHVWPSKGHRHPRGSNHAPAHSHTSPFAGASASVSGRRAHAAASLSAVALCKPRFVRKEAVATAAALGSTLFPMASKADAAAAAAGAGVGVDGGSSGNGGGAAIRGSRVIAAAAVSSDSPMPNLFDGSTRLYFDPSCPYAQRTLIAVKHKELEEVQLVQISLRDKPKWYTETVYPPGKVPSLEHNGSVMGESLDIVLYLDQHFDGPSIVPQDEKTRAAAEEILQLLSSDLVKAGYLTLSDHYDGGTADDVEKAFGPTLDNVEQQLQQRQGDGPFFLGSEFSYVDIALLPFLERFDIALRVFTGFDMSGSTTRPRLTRWLKACYELQSYKETTLGEERIRDLYKFMLDQGYFKRVFGMAAAKSG